MMKRSAVINMPVVVEVTYELDEEKLTPRVTDAHVLQPELHDATPWILAHEIEEDGDITSTMGLVLLRDLLEDEDRALHLANPYRDLKPLCKEKEEGDLITSNLGYFGVVMQEVLCLDCLEIFKGIWDRNEEAMAKAREERKKP